MSAPDRRGFLCGALGVCGLPWPAALEGPEPGAPPRPRPGVRAAGLEVGCLPSGPLSALTDVAGVAVGQATLISGQGIRTGVTAVLPHPGNLFRDKVPAALAVGNGFGKLLGSTQLEELGVLESPILLASTLAVYRVADGALTWLLARPGNEGVLSANIVVGETNDGYLNDIRLRAAGGAAAVAALEAARPGAFGRGVVGAGTGTRCFGFKGGIGTASRRAGAWTLGALVQTNFGGRLTILGVPMDDLAPCPSEAGGSCMIVLATDAPLQARELGRLARRAFLALGRLGSVMSHGSGDYALAFSTGRGAPEPEERLTELFRATVEAVEEAVLDSLFAAVTVEGFQGRVVQALPVERVLERLERAGRR